MSCLRCWSEILILLSMVTITKEEGIQELAQAIGMVVMVPTGQEGVGTTHANNRYDHFLVSKDLAD
jgi:hypothetical protein